MDLSVGDLGFGPQKQLGLIPTPWVEGAGAGASLVRSEGVGTSNLCVVDKKSSGW